MDSASGSMQSSSGGDEEYDSRTESISSFLNQNTNNHHNPLGHHHVAAPMPPPHNHHSTMFEPLSSFFDPLSTPSSSSSSRSVPPLSNPNSLLNLDLVWSKNIRSEPNCTDLGGFMSASTLNQPQNRQNIPSAQIPQPPGTSPQLSVTGQAKQITINQHNNNSRNNNVVGRNPKKRSRASRRAPTTVLTTDTSNFRAMVQEFTGIPAPPFTSTPFPRTRLDLYGTSSPTLRSAAAHLEAAPPAHPSYLLRPFAQRIQQSTSSFLSSSSIDAIVSATTTAYTNINTSTTPMSTSSTSINYQQLPQNLLNISMQNPILNFQPLLPPPSYPLTNSQILGSAAPGKSSQPPQQQQVSLENIPSGDSHVKMTNLLEDFGLGHGLQSMAPQQDLNESGRDHHHQQQQQGLFMSINGNFSSSETVGSNRKVVNFSASSTSDFQGDKVQDNVLKARSEGMMESWICSSD